MEKETAKRRILRNDALATVSGNRNVGKAVKRNGLENLVGWGHPERRGTKDVFSQQQLALWAKNIPGQGTSGKEKRGGFLAGRKQKTGGKK